MSEVLHDLSPAALEKANEANLYALTPISHNWPQADVYAGPEISWCVTDIPFGMCNPVFRARLKPEEVDTTIASLITRARTRNVPLQWWVGQDTKPADLGEHLVVHGFTLLGDGTRMAIDLLSMKEDMPAPAGLIITEVKDTATLQTWCQITATGFGMPPGTDNALLQWLTMALEFEMPMRFYLGCWDGEPVATSHVFFAEGVAGIYFVATLPEARQRGIGFAITLRPLQEAREIGFRVGILQASKMGEPVYRSMGFQSYSRTRGYIWFDKSTGTENKSG